MVSKPIAGDLSPIILRAAIMHESGSIMLNLETRCGATAYSFFFGGGEHIAIYTFLLWRITLPGKIYILHMPASCMSSHQHSELQPIHSINRAFSIAPPNLKKPHRYLARNPNTWSFLVADPIFLQAYTQQDNRHSTGNLTGYHAYTCPRPGRWCCLTLPPFQKGKHLCDNSLKAQYSLTQYFPVFPGAVTDTTYKPLPMSGAA